MTQIIAIYEEKRHRKQACNIEGVGEEEDQNCADTNVIGWINNNV